MQVHTEFPRPIDLRALPRQPIELVADAGERAALADRFDIVSIGLLIATATIVQDAEGINIIGRITAALVQNCAVSGEDFPTRINCDYRLRFMPQEAYSAMVAAAGDEYELTEGDLDTVPYSGSTLELGEAIAQTLALEIDPYAEGPKADSARVEYGLSTPEDNGPFAALKALKGK